MLDVNLDVSSLAKLVANGLRSVWRLCTNSLLEHKAECGDSAALRERLDRAAASKRGASGD